ncbi:7TM diverse intracellular signaling domain-containing protein [Pseudobacteriovorax antillogorgiicola]|uniref:Histidine kinase-, DNA gyrase B-, and HSP90-like ATPase n=1 Tax=Pseudobacteriovorax antillogorgiicola TaxID=1513793 RepID=A0A1Y6CKL4_9BACT|nr:7TM diverse intracellular signaling domain-containing protein [Pseudobacteriovorax antillogorgiicola]TCS48271.1 histidine kinase/DNA gyrase B/HSP90-like ATPase [Pseudobacteriovorax antillogorgiicola]SMF57087.1 Histidine kinase-, DNA gyrase B-, and HSP90-like ATPase [Pseudobacteriovorax antillogorgiicola]
MHFVTRFVLVLTTMLPAGAGLAAIDVTKTLTGEFFGEELEIMEDGSGSLSFEDMDNPGIRKQFRASEKSIPNFGFTSTAIWARFTLSNNLETNKKVIIEFRYASIDRVDLYYLNEYGQTVSDKVGDKVPYNTRKVSNRYPSFLVDVPPGQTQYYIRVRSTGTTMIPLVFWDESEFNKHAVSDSHLLGHLYGVVMAIALYNLFLYVTLNSKVYLFYVLHLVFFLFHNWAAQGSSVVYFMNDFPNHWISNQGFLVFAEISTIFAVYFAIEFLNTRDRYPKITKFLTFIRWLAFINIINVQFFSFELGARIANFNVAASCFSMLYMGVFSLRSGYRPAYFYTLAWALTLVASIILAMKYQGILPVNWITSWAHSFGVAAGAILMSLALGDRFNYYRNKKEKEVRDLSERLAASLANVEEQVREKTRDIRSIMENIQQGIFMIGRDHKILPDYSQFLSKIFNRSSIKDTDGLELLFENSNLNLDEQDKARTVIGNCIGEDSINFDANAHNLVSELRFQSEDSKEDKILEVDWSPIEDDDSVERLLVTVRDVTEVKALEHVAEEQKKRLNAIDRIMHIREDKFNGFVRNFLDMELHCREILSATSAGENDINKLFRYMHTIKGAARILGLKEISSEAHHIESYFDRVRKGKDSYDRKIIDEMLDQLRHTLDFYQHINYEVLGRNDDNVITSASQEEILSVIESMSALSLTPDLEAGLSKIRSLITSPHGSSFHESLSDVLDSLDDISIKLGKERPEVVIDDYGFTTSQKGEQFLRNIFVHLFRNSLDHGIEPNEVRREKGKIERGKIIVKLEEADDKHCRITYFDDGQGINVTRLRQKLVNDHLLEDPNSVSHGEVIEYIFHPGVTTAKQVTDISGRGVGMDAIKGFLLEVGGNIKIDYNDSITYSNQDGDEFVTFKIIIDLPLGLVAKGSGDDTKQLPDSA